MIQRMFGKHDVGGIRAHTDAHARDGAGAMGAEAYAHGNQVVFGGAPTLHTAAHEAAHVVQQRAGIAAKSGATGDRWEQHADAVADRVVAGQSAEALLSEAAGQGASATPARAVQRKIVHGSVVLPTTWKKTNDSLGKKIYADAEQAFEDARALLGGASDDVVEKAWNEVAGAKKTKTKANVYDLAVKDQVAKEVEARAKKSKQCADNKRKRDDAMGEIVEPLCTAHGDLHVVPGAYATLMPGTMAKHPFVDHGAPHNEQRHLSTILLASFGGIEAQSAFGVKSDNIAVSTNSNDQNDAMRTQLTSRKSLKDLTAQFAIDNGIETMTREQVMANRPLRHAVKLYTRINQYLKSNATVTVPPDADIDGQHAEIRIEKLKDGTPRNVPSGTKLPCLGCTLYFHDHGHVTAKIVQAGPIWLSFAAISSQIEQIAAGAHSLRDLNDDQIEKIGKLLADQFNAIAANSQTLRIGESWQRGGLTSTTDHDPDSEPEDDPDAVDYQEGLNRILDNAKPQFDTNGDQVKRDRPSKKRRLTEAAKKKD